MIFLTVSPLSGLCAIFCSEGASLYDLLTLQRLRLHMYTENLLYSLLVIPSISSCGTVLQLSKLQHPTHRPRLLNQDTVYTMLNFWLVRSCAVDCLTVLLASSCQCFRHNQKVQSTTFPILFQNQHNLSKDIYSIHSNCGF